MTNPYIIPHRASSVGDLSATCRCGWRSEQLGGNA
jgi:hypothetical protein